MSGKTEDRFRYYLHFADRYGQNHGHNDLKGPFLNGNYYYRCDFAML